MAEAATSQDGNVTISIEKKLGWINRQRSRCLDVKSPSKRSASTRRLEVRGLAVRGLGRLFGRTLRALRRSETTIDRLATSSYDYGRHRPGLPALHNRTPDLPQVCHGKFSRSSACSDLVFDVCSERLVLRDRANRTTSFYAAYSNLATSTARLILVRNRLNFRDEQARPTSQRMSNTLIVFGIVA